LDAQLALVVEHVATALDERVFAQIGPPIPGSLVEV
jgi:hypothetical protein